MTKVSSDKHVNRGKVNRNLTNGTSYVETLVGKTNELCTRLFLLEKWLPYCEVLNIMSEIFPSVIIS